MLIWAIRAQLLGYTGTEHVRSVSVNDLIKPARDAVGHKCNFNTHTHGLGLLTKLTRLAVSNTN